LRRYNQHVESGDMLALPGGDLVMAGLRDLQAGVESIEAALVRIGATNLRAHGFDVPTRDAQPSAEHSLYALLAGRYGNAAHSRYNALLRRLVSFERALRAAGTAQAQGDVRYQRRARFTR
jgi:hypothetical protein